MFVAPPSFFVCGIWGEKLSHHCAFSMSAKVIHSQNFGRGGTDQNTCLSYLPETPALCNNPAPPKHFLLLQGCIPLPKFPGWSNIPATNFTLLVVFKVLFIQLCTSWFFSLSRSVQYSMKLFSVHHFAVYTGLCYSTKNQLHCFL